MRPLTPDKLAAFYRLVGGNFDTIFLETPHPSLALIYRSLGCYHTLQPVKNPFAAPSIPALTPQGFVRWQTIQVLLGPAQHVPFLQAALKRFDITKPHHGGSFPKQLPSEAFPGRPDPAMTKWHDFVLNTEFGIKAPPQLNRRSSKTTKDIGSVTDYSSDEASVVDAPPRPRPRSGHGLQTNARDEPISPITRRTTTLSSDSVPFYHHHHRRRSVSHNDSPRNNPTPTERSHNSLQQSSPAPTPGMLSITTGSENPDEGSVDTESSFNVPPNNRQNFHQRPQPYYDSNGRRHSAHSPYDERDHIPQLQTKKQSTLSPPFFASQTFVVPQPALGVVPCKDSYHGHRDHGWSGYNRTNYKNNNSNGGTTPSTTQPIAPVRDDPGYFDDRPRRRPTEPESVAGGRRIAVEGVGR